MTASDVTDPDTADQSLVARPHQHAELVDEKRVGHVVVHHAQVDRGQPLYAKGTQVFFDVGTQPVGIVVGQ